MTTLAPDALRGRQVFLLGSTGFVGWAGVARAGRRAGGGAAARRWRLARALDALTLGDDSAASLGLSLPRIRVAAGRRAARWPPAARSRRPGWWPSSGWSRRTWCGGCAPAPHGWTLLAGSAAAGGVLLLAADVLARGLIAPQELPVGVLTAVLGGGYLLWLLRRGGAS